MGIFHPVAASLSSSQVLGEVFSSQIEETPEQMWRRTFIVARVFEKVERHEKRVSGKEKTLFLQQWDGVRVRSHVGANSAVIDDQAVLDRGVLHQRSLQWTYAVSLGQNISNRPQVGA